VRARIVLAGVKKLRSTSNFHWLFLYILSTTAPIFIHIGQYLVYNNWLRASKGFVHIAPTRNRDNSRSLTRISKFQKPEDSSSKTTHSDQVPLKLTIHNKSYSKCTKCILFFVMNIRIPTCLLFFVFCFLSLIFFYSLFFKNLFLPKQKKTKNGWLPPNCQFLSILGILPQYLRLKEKTHAFYRISTDMTGI
jgi:hypothetical protein